MKLWTKIYIITLGVFLILINTGFFMVFNMTYKKDMETEKDIAQTAFEMIDSSFAQSMESLHNDGRLGDNALAANIKILEQYYAKQNVSLMLYNDSETVYSKDDVPMDAELFSADKILLTQRTEEGVPVIYITKAITDYEKSYYLCYRKPLYELNETWENLQNKYLLMSAACSVILAIALFFILNRLMRPVEDLSRAVAKVKQDGYDIPSHVRVKGHDDIAKLGENFNEMSDIIAENMKAIRLENEKKQQFVDNFAHELKSPLTSIYGFAEYLAKAKVSEDEKEECMQFIMDESSRMLDMAYNLMDLSEIRNKEISKEAFDAEEFALKVESILRDRLARKNQTLHFDISTSRLYGNKGLLESLIGNIIANSANASAENKEIRLSISAEGDMNKFVIADDGCGMSEDELQHIFEPFYRADKARSRKNGSTGLGLSVCKQIVEAHNGSIYFESEKGIGTTATILLPAG